MHKLRINWAVLSFFIFYFIILQAFNDWQYAKYTKGGGTSWINIKYRLFTIPFDMFAHYLFYRWAVPFLLKKKFGIFFLLVMLFIVLLDVYSYSVDWVIRLSFLDLYKEYKPLSWSNYQFPIQSFHFTFINLIGITGFAYFLNRVKEEKIMQQLKEQHLQLELNYLKAQLHPHFFFNTMNNIYSLALYRSEKTAPVVEKLSQMMRYIIYEGQKNVVPLNTEIDFLKNFVALEKIRHNENIPISFTVQGNSDEIAVPPLLFMPLMENGFKHGFHDNQSPLIESAMLIENNEIIFEVKNSYMCDPATDKPGIGLENLRKRLELLYPHKHELLIQKSDTKFEVSLIVKLI